jgi:N-acetylglucosaminyldiphosphoundecaprenol N-acetyl-beta-D-mannosaminyltransferase
MQNQESSGKQRPSYRVGALDISAVDMSAVIAALQQRAAARLGGYVCVSNLKATMSALDDPEFAAVCNRSVMTVPDGMPLVWFGWASGFTKVRRVAGPDLLEEVLRISSKLGYTHFLYGDTEETLSTLRGAIEKRLPGVCIVGTCSPPFRPLSDEELNEMAALINRANPTFVWVSLGAPKQELWMGRMASLIQGSIMIGVGAAFRCMLGQYRRPPRILRLIGLEGFFWRWKNNPVVETKWYLRTALRYCGLLLGAICRK